jgi:hypothetical protein
MALAAGAARVGGGGLTRPRLEASMAWLQLYHQRSEAVVGRVLCARMLALATLDPSWGSCRPGRHPNASSSLAPVKVDGELLLLWVLIVS